MKKLLLIIALFAFSKIWAQPTVTFPYLGTPKSITFPQGWLRVDSGFLNAVKDTIIAPTRVGEQRFRPADSTIYVARSLVGQKWSPIGGGGSTVVTTLPIINKANVANGLSINLPFIQDGGTSPQFPSYNLTQISTNTILSNFTDGIMAFNWKDSAIIVSGGWNNSPATTDTIRISTDGGATFSFKSRFPYLVHTAGHVASLDGYFYWMGADYLSSATNQKTVTRTNDFVTFDTRTTNAAFGARILSAAWEWNGALFVGGGQSDLAATNVFNDIWRSTDGGTTWTLWNSSAMAGTDSVMRGNAYNTVVVFNRALYKITNNVYPNTSSKKVFKSLDGGLSWVRISDYPFSLGVSYPATTVWDGKLWAFGGNNGSNTSNIAYLDKTDTWNISPNYIDVSTSTVITPTHASDIIVYKDHIVNPLGNLKNDVWSFTRSKYLSTLVVRDSARFAPLANRIAADTTNYKPVVSNSVGTIAAFSSWGGIAPNGFGMNMGSVIGNSPVSGRVLFVGSVNQLDQSGDITFDSTLKRLGVGLGGASAQAPLHVKRSTSGEVIREESSSGAGAIGFDANGMYLQPITASMGVWLYNNAGSSILEVLAGGTIRTAGTSPSFGIGVAPSTTLEVNGSMMIDGAGSLQSATSGIANTETKILSSDVTMAANRLVVGTVIEIVLHGTCTSTAAGVGTINVRYGTNGTTADGVLQAFTLGAAQTSGTSIPFTAHIIITIKTTGASATSDGGLDLINQGTTGISTTATEVIRGSATNINTTTAATYLTVSYISGNANTTTTFQDAVIKFSHK